nr:MAG TPA: hypothetical protein [Caudoviricetes sp.]
MGIVKHPVELAAQFIRRADYVLANDVLRDEYGVEYGNPAQIGYCSIDPEDIIGKALERTASVFGCLTHTENDIFLTIVGEKEAIDKLEEVRLVALSDEYGYKNALNRALLEADIAGIGKKQFDKWQEDYVEGFFDGLIGNFDLGSFSKNPHVLGILAGADSAWRYVKDKENK